MFSHDTCHAAEKGNSDSQVFFVQRSQQAKLGCVSQALKEGILLTSWHLMAVVRKGKISVSAASNCT